MAVNNSDTGFYLSSSSLNVFEQNTADSNSDYGIDVTGSSSDNVFRKNIIQPGVVNPTYGFSSGNDTAVDCRYNWWGSTDSQTIATYIRALGSDTVNYTPFRLGKADTTAGADTIAPAAPDSATLIDSSQVSTSCTITWTACATSEEIGGPAPGDLAGYRVYRCTDALFSVGVTLVGAPATTVFVDSGIIAGETTYYRITSYDNGGDWGNESWYSDTIVTVVILAKPGDFINTGTSANAIDDADLGYLNGQVALYWGVAPADPRTDLSGDGILDFEDIAIFATLYGQ